MPEIVLTGDKKLNRKLKKLGGKEAKKIVRKAMRPALKPVMRAARRNAPKDTGLLRKSIKVRSGKRSRAGISMRVTSGDKTGNFSGDTYYGGFHEFGTSRGIKAKHFMKNAADQKKRSAIKIYRAKIAQGIKELASGGSG